jgi:hypothetical protein
VPHSSSAMSQLDREIPILFERATNVVEGRVLSIAAACDEKGCSSDTEVEVQASYKGKVASGEKIRFCGITPVTVGFHYIFFLEPPTRELHAGCSRYVERDAVFQRFDEKVYRYMSQGSFNVALQNGAKYITGWIEEENFDRLLVERDGEFEQGVEPSFDAALGIAIRSMGAYSTCQIGEPEQEDPDITGTLYANDYIVLEREKHPQKDKILYGYLVRG